MDSASRNSGNSSGEGTVERANRRKSADSHTPEDTAALCNDADIIHDRAAALRRVSRRLHREADQVELEAERLEQVAEDLDVTAEAWARADQAGATAEERAAP